MDFKIGAVAKMTGLSPSGIRYLEEQGLLSPSGGRKGSYRAYSLADVSAILDYRNYRKCGLSQEDILQLFKGGDRAAETTIFDQHCDELERQLQETTRLLHFLRHRSRDVANIRHADSFREIAARPPIIWMPLTPTNGKHVEWPEENGFEIPYADSVLMFDTAALTAPGRTVLPELGIGMLESDVLNVSFLGHENVRYFASREALHCIVEVSEDFLISVSSLDRCRAALEELRAEGEYAIQSDEPSVSKRILTRKRRGEVQRFDHLWIPVKKISKDA